MKNNTKKQTITAAARKLFYENGYNATSMEMIAQSCGIQKQLITYYFGSKESLGSAVSAQYREEHRQAFMEAGAKLKLKNSFYSSSAYNIWMSRYYKADEKARRFYCDMLSASETTIGPLEDGYLAAQPPANLDLNTPDFYDYITSYYAAYWFMYHYCRGEIDIIPTEFEHRFFTLLEKPYFKDDKRMERMYMGARAFLDNLEIEICDDFEIKVSIKQL